MSEQESKAEVKRVLYIGDDNSYWEAIRGRIHHSYGNMDLDTKKIEIKESGQYQSVFIQIVDLAPSILYIDLSKDFETGLQLVRLIKIEGSLSKVPVVGLVDKKELLRQCRALGVDFVHVKCGEYHDVVYDPFCVAFPNDAVKPEFAEGQFKKEIRLVEDFRIGYITEKGIHVEGNMLLEKGQLVEVETDIPQSLIPSKNYIVSKGFDNDFFYNYASAYDLDFTFVDKPEFEEDPENPREAQRIHKEKMADYSNALKMSRKRIKDWVNERMDLSLPKKTRILIVDRDLSIMREENTKPLDSYPYSIRCQSQISEDMIEVYRNRPDLIVFQFYIDPEAEKKRERARVRKEVAMDMSKAEKPSGSGEGKEEEAPVAMTDDAEEMVDENYTSDLEQDTVNQLTNLVAKVKEIEGYNPFFLIFQSKRYSSKALQQSYKYPFILANTVPMGLKHVLDLADMFQKKQTKKREQAIDFKIKQLKQQDPVKYRKLTSADFEERRYVVKKTNELSHASAHMMVELTSMTESEITFLSEKELQLGVYRFDFPVDMGVTLIKNGATDFVAMGGLKQYRGLIHSISELDKKELRKTVNEVFFKGVNEQRQKEMQEFNEKKEAAMAQREQQSSAPATSEESSED